MAENDSHYNGITNTTENQDNGQMSASQNEGAAVVLPDYEEGMPAYTDNTAGAQPAIPLPGEEESMAFPGSSNAGTPVIPLPFPGEGGPVYPGNGNGSAGNTPMIPLPSPGEGGPVYPGNGNGSANTPMNPLSFPGEGGPVSPGNGSANTPMIPLPSPREGGPVYPGNNNINRPVFPGSGSATWITGYVPVCPSCQSCQNCQTIQYYGQVRFLNASTNSFNVNISIDNTTYAANSRFGTISNYDWIADGFHTITVRRANGMRSILLQQTFPFTAGQKVTFVLTDAVSGGLDLVRVIDTGCSNLPSNAGCFRFANMTYSGSSYDLLLSGGSTIFRNIGYQQVSAYKQAAAGSYRFTITRSNTYGFIQELPVIVLGAITSSLGISNAVLTFDAAITAGRNYTAYAIGNTWSNYNLQVLTVTD